MILYNYSITVGRCEPVPTSPHAVPSILLSTEGSEVEYQCDIGYQGVTTTITCSGGNWTPLLISCTGTASVSILY